MSHSISYCKSCDDLISIIPQLGVRAEGFKELFTDRPGISKDFGVTDFAAIMKIVSKLVCYFFYVWLFSVMCDGQTKLIHFIITI